MKKILSVLLCALLCISLAACAGKIESSSSPSSSKAESQPSSAAESSESSVSDPASSEVSDDTSVMPVGEYETRTFKDMNFELRSGFGYTEKDNTVSIVLEQGTAAMTIVATDISGSVDSLDADTIHTVAIESFVSSFEEVQTREDNFVDLNGTRIKTASFSAKVDSTWWFCSVTSIIDGPMQYSISYAYDTFSEGDETYLDEYNHLLETVSFS